MTNNFGAGTFMYPPNIQIALTGASIAHQSKRGMITIIYTDGSTESRDSDKPLADFPSWFAIVGFVQDGRARTVEG
jgi:hypothetical protein